MGAFMISRMFENKNIINEIGFCSPVGTKQKTGV